MKHRKYKPDISDWELEAFKVVEQGLRDAVSMALHLAFESDETYIYFPVEWHEDSSSDGLGGKSVACPLTVYLRVGLGSYGEEKPTYEFNLRDALSLTIEQCAKDGSSAEGLGRLSVSLRELADDIDRARASGLVD